MFGPVRWRPWSGPRGAPRGPVEATPAPPPPWPQIWICPDEAGEGPSARSPRLSLAARRVRPRSGDEAAGSDVQQGLGLAPTRGLAPTASWHRPTSGSSVGRRKLVSSRRSPAYVLLPGRGRSRQEASCRAGVPGCRIWLADLCLAENAGVWPLAALWPVDRHSQAARGSKTNGNEIKLETWVQKECG